VWAVPEVGPAVAPSTAVGVSAVVPAAAWPLTSAPADPPTVPGTSVPVLTPAPAGPLAAPATAVPASASAPANPLTFPAAAVPAPAGPLLRYRSLRRPPRQHHWPPPDHPRRRPGARRSLGHSIRGLRHRWPDPDLQCRRCCARRSPADRSSRCRPLRQLPPCRCSAG